ncbi:MULTISPECIES: hypothetical protein [unclassified Streptomyces]|uniref:hypothetical protein n=1 Tax=unclassified Streptomyces TaxID=2593676 RepID=UPI0023663E5C|nr:MULTISPECIES: hypothetical protein [unclassified Streptomyces]MDF3146549.1 hypothetical protein [Streptomyces sp. T21Q-yed]WDF40520.1 hypothetical protein PBV52_28955 [Streptomyces sp. T12]
MRVGLRADRAPEACSNHPARGATNSQEFWSLPADTVKECTAAIGTLRAPGDPVPGQATTAKRC